MTDYRAAGVDLDAADEHVRTIGPIVESTWSQEVVGGFGGFAAGVRLPAGLIDPVLMMSTDGVGTKLELARRTGRWDGVGFDLVAMCVDDLAATGARPIGFVDYLAVGALDPSRDTRIVESIAAACRAARCPLVGGETAEHPGVMEADAIDLAGTALGVVEAHRQLQPENVRPGDVVVGLRSPNLRSNGFSLVRKVFADLNLDDIFPGEDAPAGEVLLGPSVIYAPAVIAAVESGGVRAAAHVTGGGLIANLARSVPEPLEAVVDHWAWEWPNVFVQVQRHGGISVEEMRRTFNLGIGFCLVVDPDAVGAVTAATSQHHPTVIGEIRSR